MDGTRVVVWDLGNVLIPWNRRGAMLAATGDEERARSLAAEVFTLEVNDLLDRGAHPDEIKAAVEHASPGHAWVVDAYIEHFRASLGPQMEGSARLLGRLLDAGHRCVGLSNWAAITFEGIPEQYPALAGLEGIVISGELGFTKPDPRIFAHTERRFGFTAAQATFIDDSQANVAAAAAVGWDPILFTDAAALEEALGQRRLIPRA